MSFQKENILFVVHEASRSGAPLILLGIIREFKKQSDIPFQILVMQDGPLVDDFRDIGETYVWYKNTKYTRSGIQGKGIIFLHKIPVLVRGLYIMFCIRSTTLVFLNTISTGHIQKKLLWLRCKFICYVHELETVIRVLTSPETLTVTKKNTNYFLAGSSAVKENLIEKHQIPANKISVVYSSLLNTLQQKKNFLDFKKYFWKENKLNDDHVLIGVASNAEWRKGFDLLYPLMSLYISLYPDSNVKFVWKGYREKKDSKYYDLFDFQKSGLENYLILLPHGGENIETISCFDMHLLLSREDPYPLVVLEAATFGIPTIAFDNAGGSVEFIEKDAGIIIPYGNILAMCRAINLLVNDKVLREKLGIAANQKVGKRHDQRRITSGVIQIIDSVLNNGEVPAIQVENSTVMPLVT